VVENATWGMVAEFTVPWVASASPYGREVALKWIESKDEAIASAGWQTNSSMVAIKEDADLDLGEIKSLMKECRERGSGGRLGSAGGGVLVFGMVW